MQLPSVPRLRNQPDTNRVPFCAGSIARLDDFRTLELVRNGRSQKFKFKRDKGHHRELELTVNAVRNHSPAPIPFAELVEVTDATFRVTEAIGISLESPTESPAVVPPKAS